jgi:hypothetical protein
VSQNLQRKKFYNVGLSNIMEEMDTYHNVSIIETLASTIFLKLVSVQ